MGLVLGAHVGVGAAGAPLPAPPERWRLGERGRRALRRALAALALLALAALGALHGATTAIGAEGVSELAAPAWAAALESAESPRDLRGSFWRPQGSNAQRPPAELAPRRWRPERSD
jgi:hypothetical protein